MIPEFIQAVNALHQANDALEYGIKQYNELKKIYQNSLNEINSLKEEINKLKLDLKTLEDSKVELMKENLSLKENNCPMV